MSAKDAPTTIAAPTTLSLEEMQAQVAKLTEGMGALQKELSEVRNENRILKKKGSISPWLAGVLDRVIQEHPKKRGEKKNSAQNFLYQGEDGSTSLRCMSVAGTSSSGNEYGNVTVWPVRFRFNSAFSGGEWQEESLDLHPATFLDDEAAAELRSVLDQAQEAWEKGRKNNKKK